MERFIKDPWNYTSKDLLESTDWDIVELDITVDVEGMLDWYTTIEEKYSDCVFIIPGHILQYGNEKTANKEFIEHVKQNNTYGTTFQWTLQWSYDRDGVIPFIQLADPVQFPETVDPDFIGKANNNLPKYYFGTYKNYYDAMGPDCLTTTRLVKFHKNSGLRPHVDAHLPEILIRMHLQLQADDGATLKFGDESERVYNNLRPGHIYLLNTSLKHDAKNNSRTPWVFVHNNPTPDAVDRLLKTRQLHIS